MCCAFFQQSWTNTFLIYKEEGSAEGPTIEFKVKIQTLGACFQGWEIEWDALLQVLLWHVTWSSLEDPKVVGDGVGEVSSRVRSSGWQCEDLVQVMCLPLSNSALDMLVFPVGVRAV